MTKLRIALLIESSRGYGRELLRGIIAYAREKGNWTLFFEEQSFVDRIPPKLKQWRADGIIARINNRRFAGQLQKMALPVVNLLHEECGWRFSEVVPNQSEMVRMAVEHLVECGLRDLGFCGFPGVQWSAEREQFFISCVSAWGIQMHLFSCPAVPRELSYPQILLRNRQNTRSLARWLAKLPKPVGLLACNDERAHQVLTVCREQGITVPDQVAVVGIDNDQLLCELTDPPLSSVAPGGWQIGWEAAFLLHQIIEGRADLPVTIQTQPLGIVSRQSTNVLAVPDPEVASILAYIRQHACMELTVEHLSQAFSVSRSTLDRCFIKYFGHSVHAEIIQAVLRRAKELLTATDMPLDKIARRLGFEHRETFQRVFKRSTGETPGNYRYNRLVGRPDAHGGRKRRTQEAIMDDQERSLSK